jgi:transposase
MFQADRGRKHLNDQERAAIVAFTEAGQTVAFIGKRLDIEAATVSLWQHRFRKTGNIMRKRGSGRPTKLTPANEEDIVLAVTAKPITTAQEIAGNL